MIYTDLSIISLTYEEIMLTMFDIVLIFYAFLSLPDVIRNNRGETGLSA